MTILDTPQLLALVGAIGWGSGVRLYLVMLLTGLAGHFGWFALPGELHVLSHPAVLIASGFMAFIEFFADKIPGLDSLWDMVHTVIRIPAGAALAASVFGGDHAVMALVGGIFAATAHAAKATARAAINTSPEPFSNVGVSLIEDAMVPTGLWLAVAHPLGFALALVVVLMLSTWLIGSSWCFLRRLVNRVTRIFSGKPDPGVVSAFRFKKNRP